MASIKRKLKVKKTITLDQIAEALAQDFIGAVYSAIGTKSVQDLTSGDELAEVVDQSLSRHGMADELVRMSSTRIHVNVGVDISGSMFWRSGGTKPIVRAATVMRVMLKAFDIIAQSLPPDVFQYSLWLWAAGRGRGVACLTHEGYSDQGSGGRWTSYSSLEDVMRRLMPTRSVTEIDAVLETLTKSEPDWAGGGTWLAPMLERLSQWEMERGDPASHTLDIVVTDGELGDTENCSTVQLFRQRGKYIAMLLNIADYQSSVPDGFINYAVQTDQLEDVIRTQLLDFVQTMY